MRCDVGRLAGALLLVAALYLEVPTGPGETESEHGGRGVEVDGGSN